MNLESDKRLNIQLRLDFSSAPTGEARQAGRENIESHSVVSEPERPANTNRIMEEVCERTNLKEALRRVSDYLVCQVALAYWARASRAFALSLTRSLRASAMRMTIFSLPALSSRSRNSPRL